MLSKELVKKIKRIQLRAGFLATEALAGEYQSAFKGQGMEFDEVREYVPGDDVRAIDWNVTARMNQPFIKVYREEREMTLMLLVDVSSSQEFGSAGRTKQEVAAEVAAILAFLAIRNNDKVGLVVFSDHVEKVIPPKKGRAHVWNIIRTVLTHEHRGRGTDIGGALQAMGRLAKRKATCFLISDFLAQDFLGQLRQTARKHDLVCTQIVDPREREVPAVGVVDWLDPETLERLTFDTSSKAGREALQALLQERRELQQTWMKSRKIRSIEVRTDENTVDPIEAFFRRQAQRRRR